MPTKEEVIAIFNNKLVEFLSECAGIFNNDIMFGTYPKLAELTISQNPTLILDALHENVFDKYGDKITAKDETFLLTGEFDSDKDVSVKMIIGTLRGHWKGLDPSNKEVMWKWLQQLMKIANKAASM